MRVAIVRVYLPTSKFERRRIRDASACSVAVFVATYFCSLLSRASQLVLCVRVFAAAFRSFQATKQFLGDCQKLVNYFLIVNGFSVGIGDTIASGSTLETVRHSARGLMAFRAHVTAAY